MGSVAGRLLLPPAWLRGGGGASPARQTRLGGRAARGAARAGRGPRGRPRAATDSGGGGGQRLQASVVPACAQAHAAAQGLTDTKPGGHTDAVIRLYARQSAHELPIPGRSGARTRRRAVPAESAPGRPAARGPAARPLGEQVRRPAALAPLRLVRPPPTPEPSPLRGHGTLLQLSCLSQPRPSPTESGPGPERGQPPEKPK